MTITLPAFLTDDRCSRHGWLVLLMVCAALYLPGLGTLPMMDRDEPRFAHATVEMMRRGSWAVPYFNDEYRFDKPPLTYWWMALHFRVFGISEWSARLHTVIATWMVSLVIAGMAARLTSPRAGLFAGFAWLTTVQVIIHGRLCVADMPMVLCVALAMRALSEIMLGDDAAPAAAARRAVPGIAWTRWHAVLYVALGFGFLAKGPVALLVPVLALALHRIVFWRKPLPWSRLRLLPGSVIALAIIAGWGVPALVETRGLFWKVGMGEHVIDRGVRALNGRFPVPGYYVATAWMSLFPWIILLPIMWQRVRARWSAQLALLVSWFLVPYVIFTFYATQLPHYVMPGFPAAMVLLAVVVCGTHEETAAAAGRGRGTRVVSAFAGISGLFWIGVMLVLTVASACIEWPDGLGSIVSSLSDLVSALGVAGFSIAMLTGVRKKRPAWVLAMALLLLLFVVPLAAWRVTSAIRASNAAAILAEHDAVTLPAKTDLIACQFTEPSLVFHFDRIWRYTNKLTSLEGRLGRKGPRYAVVLRREWTLSEAVQRALLHKRQDPPVMDNSAAVDALVKSHPDYEHRTHSVFNAARSSWAELVVMKRP